MKGFVYEAASVSRILGLPCACSDPVPTTEDGEIVVYYGGWGLRQLRTSCAGNTLMWQQDWFDEKEWKAEAGYYRLLLPVPGSNCKNWSEQLAHLRAIGETWQPAPVCVAATALLVHLTKTGNDLLRNDGCRCAEAPPGGYHVELVVCGGRGGVYVYWDGYRSASLWLAASRKC